MRDEPSEMITARGRYHEASLSISDVYFGVDNFRTRRQLSHSSVFVESLNSVNFTSV
jgi:hypothetical protein